MRRWRSHRKTDKQIKAGEIREYVVSNFKIQHQSEILWKIKIGMFALWKSTMRSSSGTKNNVTIKSKQQSKQLQSSILIVQTTRIQSIFQIEFYQFFGRDAQCWIITNNPSSAWIFLCLKHTHGERVRESRKHSTLCFSINNQLSLT